MKKKDCSWKRDSASVCTGAPGESWEAKQRGLGCLWDRAHFKNLQPASACPQSKAKAGFPLINQLPDHTAHRHHLSQHDYLWKKEADVVQESVTV
jgi:hypothetical protein